MAAHAWALNLGLFAWVAAVCAFAIIKSTRARALGLVLLAAGAGASSIGWYTVLALRADAPTRVGVVAERIAGLVGRLDAFASSRNECIGAVRNACTPCEPLLRFVLPVRAHCAHARGKLDLGRDALEAGCMQQGDALDCGSSSL